MQPQFEFTFSYWIFGWFLFYYFGLTKFNPKIWLIIALLENIVGILYVIIKKYKVSLTDVILYTIANIVIKVWPLWVLRNTSYRWTDFIMGFLNLIGFFIWMLFRLGSIQSIHQYYKENINKIVEKKLLIYLYYFN
jgi:hypothetical protein